MPSLTAAVLALSSGGMCWCGTWREPVPSPRDALSATLLRAVRAFTLSLSMVRRRAEVNGVEDQEEVSSAWRSVPCLALATFGRVRGGVSGMEARRAAVLVLALVLLAPLVPLLGAN